MPTNELINPRVPLIAQWRDYYTLTKPRVVQLLVFTAVVGMFLSTPGMVPWDVLILGSLGIGLAAASGAGLITPSVVDIYEETAQRGAYHEQALRYGGESRARGYTDAAAANRLKAKAVKSGAVGAAIASGVSGIAKSFG